MSKATITLEDDENGYVVQTVRYDEKFDVESNAHQYASIMLRLAEAYLADGRTFQAPAAEDTDILPAKSLIVRV